MSEQKNIPNIRFPEFSEGIVIESLDEKIELLGGIAFKGEDILEDKTGIPILRGINITEGYIRHSLEIDRYYKGDATSLEKYRLKVGDLVLGMDGSKVGKNVALIKENDEGSLLIQRVARVRAKKNTDINYVYHNIFSPRFHKYVDAVNTSSGIPHISSKQIKEFEIPFPTLPEQQKIAAFLTGVDEK